MAKIIYVEPDEEITNLVDRLRSEKVEKELVFVLPSSSRVLQSALNARLLMQYSNSLGKKSSVVSPDSRSQSVAIDTGFRVFPTMAAYEAGGALEHAADPDRGVMADVPDDYDQTTRSVRPARAAVGGAAAAALGADAATREFRRAPRTTATVTGVKGATDAKPWILAGIGGVVVVLILGLIFLPSATVTILTPARPVAIPDGTVVNGATAAPTGDLGVQTTQLQAQESAPQQQFTATGTKTVAGVPATGQVTFTNSGFQCVSFPKDTQVQTDSGVKFRTNDATAPIGRPSICGTTKTATVGVHAEQAGIAGNVAAGAITHINETSDPALTVNNDSPTTGGTDPVNKTIVSQQDLDKAKSQLGDPLVQKVKDELKQKAGKEKYLSETEKFDVAPTYDHKVNDEYPNCPCQFNASVQVTGKVTTVDDGKVKDVLFKALQKQVPKDYQLTDDIPTVGYKVASHDDQGAVSFTAAASGFMAQAVDTRTLQSALTGKSPRDAQTYIRTRALVDVVDVRIHLTPSFMPWLPWMSGRIEIKRQVDKPQPG